MSAELDLKYRLARTVVKIDGTLTVDIGDDGNPATTCTSQIALACEADPDVQLSIHIDPGWHAQRKFDLKLAADGRLAGASDASTGLGAQIIGGAVTVATVAAKIAATATLAAFAGATDTVAAKSLEEEFEEANQPAARRRRELKAAIATLDDCLISLVRELAKQEGEPPSEYPTRLPALQDGLSAARAELAAVEAEYQAWKAAAHPPRAATLSYLVATDRLPLIKAVEEQMSFDQSDLKGQAESAERLGVVVAIVADEKMDSREKVQRPGDQELVYRVPRRVELAVYQLADASLRETENAAQNCYLKQVIPAWIIDRQSDVGRVPLNHGFFRDHTTSVTFGSAGTLTELSNTETSAPGTIAAGFKGAGSQITGTLDELSKISTAFAPPAPTDPALDALKAQVMRKELQARLAKANAAIAAGN